LESLITVINRSCIMPYLLAWLLGVPAFILVLIWLFMH